MEKKNARKKPRSGPRAPARAVKKLTVEQLRQISGGLKKDGGGKGWECIFGSRVYGCTGMSSDG